MVLSLLYHQNNDNAEAGVCMSMDYPTEGNQQLADGCMRFGYHLHVPNMQEFCLGPISELQYYATVTNLLVSVLIYCLRRCYDFAMG